MMSFLTIGLALLAIFVIAKIIGYVSLRLGVVALGVAGIIFLMKIFGG